MHGSGDAANSALIGGRLVALVRIRVLDEVRWVYGWSQNMWREIVAGGGPARSRTPPSITPGSVAAPARSALSQWQTEPDFLAELLESASTPEDLRELLSDDEDSPAPQTVRRQVTWSADLSSVDNVG